MYDSCMFKTWGTAPNIQYYSITGVNLQVPFCLQGTLVARGGGGGGRERHLPVPFTPASCHFIRWTQVCCTTGARSKTEDLAGVQKCWRVHPTFHSSSGLLTSDIVFLLVVFWNVPPRPQDLFNIFYSGVKYTLANSRSSPCIVESWFLEPPRISAKIVLRNREIQEIHAGGKITENFIQGKRVSVQEIRRFEKSRVQEINIGEFDSFKMVPG